MRLPVVVGSWMNTGANEAVESATVLRKGIAGAKDVEVVVCPPAAFLMPMKAALRGSSIGLGAQNVCDEEEGAHVDEMSAIALADLCEYVTLGHWERRQCFGDSNDVVNKKMAAVTKTALRPILCIGEGLAEKEAGRTSEVITRQLTSALEGVSFTGALVVAYEPIWAMGTGRRIQGKQVNDAARFIRSALANLCSEKVAETVRVLYGGNATAENVSEFIEQSEIDGALVRQARLEAEQFTDIVHLAEYVYFPNNPPIKDLIPW